jgi:uncharacterized membrane protein YgdD (TMEM256/DUF423 family)
MIGVVVILGGIALFSGTLTLLDWLARRKQRRERHAK